MSQIIGSNLGHFVKGILRKLMTDKLTMTFSWVGNKGKEQFSPLKFTAVLFSKFSYVKVLYIYKRLFYNTKIFV